MSRFFRDIYLDLLIAFLLFAWVVFYWRGDVDQITGIALAIVSVAFWIKSRVDLGRSFTVMPKAKELVTTGIYSRIRNPIYIFSFITFLGLFIAIHNPYLYPLLFIMLIVQIIRVRKEDALLYERFGKKYLDYKNQTWI